jgi:hypothetical protein
MNAFSISSRRHDLSTADEAAMRAASASNSAECRRRR